MEPPVRIELTTPALQERCSGLLSYRGIRSGTHLRISRRPFSGWVGWANWARTSDLLINSQPLYLLSYSPMLVAGRGLEPLTSRLWAWRAANCSTPLYRCPYLFRAFRALLRLIYLSLRWYALRSRVLIFKEVRPVSYPRVVVRVGFEPTTLCL